MAEAGNGNRVYVKVGNVIRLYLSYSEICVSWGVAGKAVNVQILEEGVAELLHDDGSPFPLPILLGEAGIHTDGDGRHYVPTRAVVIPQAEFDHPPTPPSLD